MQNFITLGQPLLGEKYLAQKEKKKNNPKNSGHFVLQQCQRAAHTLCSDQWEIFLAAAAKVLMMKLSVIPKMQI